MAIGHYIVKRNYGQNDTMLIYVVYSVMGAYVSLSLIGIKAPRCLISKVVPTASPQAKPIKHPFTLFLISIACVHVREIIIFGVHQ